MSQSASLSAADPEITDLGRSAWKALETLHVTGYFAPECTEEYAALGLHPRLAYFPSRAAALGTAGLEVTVATFYVFAPRLVGAALPLAWETTSPEQVVEARRRGIGSVLRRVLGDIDVSEALAIARRVCDGLTAPGRPLYAAHKQLAWPEDDLVALWHAATLIREHRGDGHISVLQTAGLGPVESLVLGGLHSGTTSFLRKTRGWTDEEWDAATAGLTHRGLLSAEGDLSDDGRAVRENLEEQTDVLAVEGWAAVGVDDTRRLRELVLPWAKAIVASDVLPSTLRKR